MSAAIQEFQFDRQFQNIFDSTAIAMTVTDLTGKWVHVNQAFCSMLGYTEAELYKKSFGELTYEGDRTEDLRIRDLMLAGEMQHYQREKRYVHRDGSLIWIRLNASILKDESGRPVNFYAQTENITARKEAEAALHESIDNFQMLAEAMPQLVWITDDAGKSIYTNKQWSDYTGLPVDYENNGSWTESFHPDDRVRTAEAWSRALETGGHYAVETGGHYAVEVRLRKHDGSYQWWLIRGVPMRDEARRVLKWFGTCTNIDALKTALDESKRNAALVAELNVLIDQARDVIVLLDVEGKIRIWNQGAEKLYGWTAAENVGRHYTEVFGPSAELTKEAMLLLFERGYWEGENERRTKSGSLVTVEGRGTLLRDEAGNPKSMLVISTDVTEQRKNLAAKLRSQRLESIGTLAGGIAHDLNNVLTPIMMGVELLAVGETNPRKLSTLEAMGRCSRRGADMVKQVLSFARGVEGERSELKPESVIRDIEQIVEDTFLKTIEVDCLINPDLWNVLGDSTQLHQVILNLAVNARDAMPTGGRLDFQAENVVISEQEAAVSEVKAGCYVRISVEDNGSGMSKETLDRVFVPFFTTKEFGKGTGLGLSTSMAIVKSHGGFMRVYSDEGKGTKFNVYIPAIRSEAEIQLASRDDVIPHGSGECILVVDDDSSVRMVARQTLELFGYRVLMAENGAQALTIYREHQSVISAVFTDIMMPGMDGIATIRELKKMNPHLKSVAASGLASNENAVDAMVFLPKPFTADSLLRALAKCLAS